jgi:hypothetical protein
MFLNFDALIVGLLLVMHLLLVVILIWLNCETLVVFVSDIGLVELVKRGLLGVGTKLELLDTNNGLKFVSEQFDSFAGYKVGT